MPNTNRTLSILSAVLSVSGFVLLAWTLLDQLGGPWGALACLPHSASLASSVDFWIAEPV